MESVAGVRGASERVGILGRGRLLRALGGLVLIVPSCGAGAHEPAPTDLSGAPVALFGATDARAIALFFVRTDCPISNRYAPEIRSIVAGYEPRGIRFWLVYPDPTETEPLIRRHLAEYELGVPALRDPDYALVHQSGVTITPEVAVFRPDRTLAYRGRIDDRHVDFGQARPAATVHDLTRALDELLAGDPITTPRTRAVGCDIPDR